MTFRCIQISQGLLPLCRKLTLAGVQVDRNLCNNDEVHNTYFGVFSACMYFLVLNVKWLLVSGNYLSFRQT